MTAGGAHTPVPFSGLPGTEAVVYVVFEAFAVAWPWEGFTVAGLYDLEDAAERDFSCRACEE